MPLRRGIRSALIVAAVACPSHVNQVRGGIPGLEAAESMAQSPPICLLVTGPRRSTVIEAYLSDSSIRLEPVETTERVASAEVALAGFEQLRDRGREAVSKLLKTRCGLEQRGRDRSPCELIGMRVESNDQLSMSYQFAGSLFDLQSLALWSITKSGEQVCGGWSAVSWSGSGDLIAYGTPDPAYSSNNPCRAVVVYDGRERREVYRTVLPGSAQINALAWAPDGRRLAILSSTVRIGRSPVNLILAIPEGRGTFFSKYYLSILDGAGKLIASRAVGQEVRNDSQVRIVWRHITEPTPK